MIEAFVLVKIMQSESGGDLDFMKSVEKKLAGVKGVKEVKGVFGLYDFVAMVEAQTPEELGVLVTQTLRNIKGVAQTETMVIGF